MGFFAAFKEIGGFAGTLSGFLSAIISFIKIIQRSSATVEFKAKLSPDSKKLFSWATDLFQVIVNKMIPLEHLTENDNLILMGASFYLSFPFLFLSISKSLATSTECSNTAFLFFISGIGSKLIPSTAGWIMLFIYPIFAVALVVLVLTIKTLFGCCFNYVEEKSGTKKGTLFYNILVIYLGVLPALHNILNVSEYQETYDKVDVIGGIIVGIAAFMVTSIPIFVQKEVFLIVMLVCFVLALIFGFWLAFSHLDKAGEWIIKIYQVLSSLFIIPIISNFVEVQNSNDGISKDLKIFIILIPICLTIFFFFLLTITKHASVVNDYRKGFHYFELFDIICKYAYAFASSYDPSLWGCISIEIATLIAICALRPFRFYHRYILGIGECIIVLVANFLAKFYKGSFSLSASFGLFVCSVIPIIVSLYVFFIFDFGNKKMKESKTDKRIINIISLIVVIVGSFMYGRAIDINSLIPPDILPAIEHIRRQNELEKERYPYR